MEIKNEIKPWIYKLSHNALVWKVMVFDVILWDWVSIDRELMNVLVFLEQILGQSRMILGFFIMSSSTFSLLPIP